MSVDEHGEFDTWGELFRRFEQFEDHPKSTEFQQLLSEIYTISRNQDAVLALCARVWHQKPDAYSDTAYKVLNLVLPTAHMSDDSEEVDDWSQLLERLEKYADHPESHDFREALDELRTLAEGGSIDAALGLAERLWHQGPNHDPEAAYKWFYIGLSQEGYTVQWEDHNHTPPYYCGPVGDFRNESLVSDLVVKLGWERIAQLDTEAAKWLQEHQPSS